MGFTIKENTTVAVTIETVEGTYEAPAAPAAFISPMASGMELSPAKEMLDRQNLNSSIGRSTPRGGMRSVSGSIPVEAKASGVAGSAPEFDPLMKSAFGSRRQAATTTVTKITGNTGSILHIEDADISKYAIGDIVMVKQSGAFHVSPIIARSTGAGTASITLLVSKPSGSFANSVVIEKVTTYVTANSGHPSLSVSKWIEGAVLEKAYGCKVSGFELSGFTVGQMASFGFKIDGAGFDRTLSAQSITPAYDSALPPVILNAKVYQAGVAVDVNDVSVSLANSLGFIMSTASENGRISSRVTERQVTGSFNPYKSDNSVANYDLFKDGTEFSMFFYMANPGASAGQLKEVVAFYLPKCFISSISEADKDGVLQDSISFSASRGADGASEEIYVSFI